MTRYIFKCTDWSLRIFNFMVLFGGSRSSLAKLKLLSLFLFRLPLVRLLVTCSILRHLHAIKSVPLLLAFLEVHHLIINRELELLIKIHIRHITLCNACLVWSVDVILLGVSNWLVVNIDLLFWAAVTLHTRSFIFLGLFPEPTSASDVLFICWQAMEMLVILVVLMDEVDFLI